MNGYDAPGPSVAPDAPNGESLPLPPSLPWPHATALHRINVCEALVLFCQVTVPPDGVETVLGRKQYVLMAVE